jgi:hypothetical protein
MKTPKQKNNELGIQNELKSRTRNFSKQKITAHAEAEEVDMGLQCVTVY